MLKSRQRPSRITDYVLRISLNVLRFLVPALVAATACTAPATAPPPFTPERATAAAAEPTRTQLPLATTTSTLPAEVAIPTVSTEDPLRFVFPTSGPAPASGWRPPQVPVPLSLRPEDHYWFARPIAADRVNWPHPFYRYGSTYFGLMTIHAGVDLDSPLGTPVYAAGPGVVVWAGYGLYGADPPEDDPYGLAVAIRHDFGYRGQVLYTVYGHLSKINVWVDQQVDTGELIGEVGETGNVTGPHLHFEVRVGENRYRASRNPELWLAPPTGWGVLAGRLIDRSDQPIPGVEIHVRSRETNREWIVFSYEPLFVNPDDLYRENFALSDLPAGEYFISAAIAESTISGIVSVYPGRTSFLILDNAEGLIFEPTILQPATLIAYVTATPTATATATQTATATATGTRTQQPSATATGTAAP